MASQVHILLTLSCNFECEHCFLYCSPSSGATFRVEFLRRLVSDTADAGMDTVYFEGGEPFQVHPLLLEGVRLATRAGLTSGVVTSGFFALETVPWHGRARLFSC